MMRIYGLVVATSIQRKQHKRFEFLHQSTPDGLSSSEACQTYQHITQILILVRLTCFLREQTVTVT